MKVRSPFFRIILIALALAAPSVWAQDGLGGALSKLGRTPSLLQNSFGQRLISADFDNDQRPDGAVLLDAGQLDGQKVFRIEFHVTAGKDHELTFASNETALAISALDVNQDGTPDIVVEQAFTHKRLHVWLNDGHGFFRKVRSEDFPSPTESPCQWRAPLGGQVDLALALPTKLGSDHAALILQALRFDSLSANWRVRPEAPFARLHTFDTRSPRGPPAYLSL
jgi:hypothetical protein